MAEKQMRVIRSEDLQAALKDIIEEMAAYGRRAEKLSTDAGEVALHLEGKPGDLDELAASARQALEDEIKIARPLEGAAGIEVTEQDREIAKRALVHIRLPILRKIAKDLDVPHAGSLEMVTDAIARKLRADRHEIARLVVKYEAEPPPDRGFTSRLFQVWEPAEDLEALATRLEYVVNRYIRTGIARWFLFDAVGADAAILTLDGLYRFFRADAATIDDDLTLAADEQSAPARLRLRRGEANVEVEAKGEQESRALMAAFEETSGLRWREAISTDVGSLEGQLATWDPVSVFLVDLLNTRFRSNQIEILNLTTAGFRTEREQPGDEEETTRPAIRSVRLEGRHLLDSRPACELLTQGQSLAQLGMIVRFKASPASEFILPLTVKHADDHLAITTGFGSTEPSIAHLVHTQVVAGVRKALRGAIADKPSLECLAREIHTRANEETAPTRPTIFAPPDQAVAASEAGAGESAEEPSSGPGPFASEE